MLYVISSYFFSLPDHCSLFTNHNFQFMNASMMTCSVQCAMWLNTLLKITQDNQGLIQQLNQTSTRSRIEPFLFPLEIMKNLHLLSLSLLFVYKRIYMQHKTTARLDRCFENWNLLKHLERTCTTFILIFSCMCDTKKKPMRNRKGKLTIHSWNAEW